MFLGTPPPASPPTAPPGAPPPANAAPGASLPCAAGTCPAALWSKLLEDRFRTNQGTSSRVVARAGDRTAVVYRLDVDGKPAAILRPDGAPEESIADAGSHVRVYDAAGAVVAKHVVTGAFVESVALAADGRIGLYLNNGFGGVSVDGASISTNGYHAVVALSPSGAVAFVSPVITHVNPRIDVRLAFAGDALVLAGNPLRGLNFPYALLSSFAKNGAVAWARAIQGVHASELTSLAVDDTGNIAVAGVLDDDTATIQDPANTSAPSLGAVAATPAFVASFDSSGALRWTKDAGLTTSPQIAFAGGGEWLATTGNVMKATTSSALQRLGADGNARWAAPWPELAERSLEVAGDRVIVTGASRNGAPIGGTLVDPSAALAAGFSAKDGAFAWLAVWKNGIEAQGAGDTVAAAFRGAEASVPAAKKDDRASMIVLRLP